MRYVQEQFTEDEFERLKAGKDGRSWREAMLEEIAVAETELQPTEGAE